MAMANDYYHHHHHLFFQKPNHSQYLSSATNMDHPYDYLNVISHGSYGTVYRALDKKTGEIVAIKHEFHGLTQSTLREIAILKNLPPHPSVVELKRVFSDEHGRVLVVMDYSETDLNRFMDARRNNPFTLCEVKFFMKQLLEGVQFLHENGIMHRDLKPANILINNKNCQLKICDFGLSRGAHWGSLSGSYTPGVVTLWYRAPELLLGEKSYSCAIDMWSVGCIMAELLLGEVLFNGNGEIEQLGKMYKTLCYPYNNLLRWRMDAAAAFWGAPLLTDCGFDLLERLLAFDPEKRITAKDALDHAWFKEYYGESLLMDFHVAEL